MAQQLISPLGEILKNWLFLQFQSITPDHLLITKEKNGLYHFWYGIINILQLETTDPWWCTAKYKHNVLDRNVWSGSNCKETEDSRVLAIPVLIIQESQWHGSRREVRRGVLHIRNITTKCKMWTSNWFWTKQNYI